MKSPHELDKALGQHFLTNKGVLEKIFNKINSFSISLGEFREVVEVGPGEER